MTELPSDMSAQLSEQAAEQLLNSLLYKEGCWVDWGKACQQLQKAGYSAQQIFERAGFQAVQQNLIIVAAQVYESLVETGGSGELLTYFQGPRSDVLYELRILKQQQRLAAAKLAQEKRLDVDGAKEVARAVQQFSRLAQLPPGFSNHPGDAIAYQCWKQAKQKKDLSERSRHIAKGLKFADSDSARQAIEQLLGEFTAQSVQTAPLIPLYRLESETQLSRLVPFAGKLPLTSEELAAVVPVNSEGAFNLVKTSQSQTIAPVPGWQAVLKAGDPVAILCQSDQLPTPLPGAVEPVLVLVDRAQRQWNQDSYFLVDVDQTLMVKWFAETPALTIWGQVILVLRPRKILDENNLTEPWQMDD